MENRPYHHNNLKEELIEKGIEIINRDGLSVLSLRKVASECNVSHSAPYSHFKNKEELLKNMQTYISEKFSEVLEKTIEIYNGDEKILIHLGRTYFNFFVENPQYFSFLYRNSSVIINLSLDSKDEENYKPFVIFKNLALKVFENSKFSKDKKENLIISLWSHIHGLTSLATMENIEYKGNLSEKLEEILSTLKINWED